MTFGAKLEYKCFCWGIGVVERHHAVEVRMEYPVWGNVEQYMVCSSAYLRSFVTAAFSCTCCYPIFASILRGKYPRRFCNAGSAHVCLKPVLCFLIKPPCRAILSIDIIGRCDAFPRRSFSKISPLLRPHGCIAGGALHYLEALLW